jgi:phage portal protein BeeE
VNLLTRLTSPPAEERHVSTIDDLVNAFTFQGWTYPFGGTSQQGPPGVPSESSPNDFEGMVRNVYYRSGIVAACIAARVGLISEARFKWRMLSDRKMFGDTALLSLERPTPNATSGDILARFEQDASLNGNGYRIRIGGQLHHVRPDAMHIVLGSNMGDGYETKDAPDATVVAYVYWPGGKSGKYDPKFFSPSEVAHYAPEPDPLAKFRGLSWVSQVLREIDTDRQLTEHKAGFLERGATPSIAIKYPPELTRGDGGKDKADQLIDLFREKHEGASNAWKALHLFGGADPVSIGSNFRDLDYKAVQGAGETRIASRARVPAAVLGISEGLQGSALNAGNFGQARRQFGEQYAYPSWRQMCEALAGLVRVPAGAELWYDTTDVAFLHEDAKDAAEVLSTQATAIRTLTDGGYDPASAITAVTGGDLSLLKHTGLVPVQLQPPGTTANPTTTPSAPAPSMEQA